MCVRLARSRSISSCDEEVKNLSHHTNTKHITTCTIRYPASAQQDDPESSDEQEVEVFRNILTGKFHCERCDFATTHGPTLQVHANRRCRLYGGIPPQERPRYRMPKEERSKPTTPSVSPSSSSSKVVSAPQTPSMPVVENVPTALTVPLMPRQSKSPGFTDIDEEHEVEDVLMADAGESEDDTWIPQEVPSGVMPEFLEGCSRDGAYEGYRSRSSSVLSYVDVGQFNTTAFARPPEQGQDDTSSSISSRSNSTVPSRQPSSTTSFTGSFTCPSSPLESRPQSHGLDPEVIKTLDRLSPPYRNDIIEVLACRGVSDKDRVNLAMQTPPAWDDIRSVLMGRGMNLMEWMLLRKALLRQLGFHLNTRIDSTTSTRPTMKNDLFLVYLNSLTSPTGTPITVPPRFFLNLGFYLLSDIHLLASFKSQWLLAGTYLLSEGLTYLQWLSLKRSLRDIAHIDKYALPPPHRSLRDFLSSLSIPLNHKGYAFNEIGIDSGVDLDLLSRFPEQWDDVFKELGSIAEFSLTEGTILQDGLRARASCFNS
ncbi:hypothetical protein NLI96_g11554 [Meripilus lineatus]|uniref:Uncharacterized protein n=1 Tax=Meripilus lineatus TaxID=2056292 RepID=A0AAD5UT46_9APHY|nr:hypothetical protein NLI96_g11554 [Physisporinus lineatus]